MECKGCHRDLHRNEFIEFRYVSFTTLNEAPGEGAFREVTPDAGLFCSYHCARNYFAVRADEEDEREKEQEGRF